MIPFIPDIILLLRKQYVSVCHHYVTALGILNENHVQLVLLATPIYFTGQPNLILISAQPQQSIISALQTLAFSNDDLLVLEIQCNTIHVHMFKLIIDHSPYGLFRAIETLITTEQNTQQQLLRIITGQREATVVGDHNVLLHTCRHSLCLLPCSFVINI